MEFEATLAYNDGTACFKIRKENPGIYSARLLYFEGPKKARPPKEIVLIRGVRHWTGSYENEELLNKLGKAIEDFLNEAKQNPGSEKVIN